MKKSRIAGTLLTIFSALIVFIVILVLAALLFFKLYIVPRYNNLHTNDVQNEISTKDIVSFAKYFTDKQLLENLKNFDKASAKDVLNVMIEIDAENSETSEMPVNSSPESKESWDKSLTEPLDKLTGNMALTPIAPSEPNITIDEESLSDAAVEQNESSAYDRIMAVATKAEIDAGLAILSKVNVSKINSLQQAGQTAELKAYLRSVLSSSEIQTALSLYNKYKHLL